MRAQPAVPAVLTSTAVRTCDLQVQVPDCERLLQLLGLVPDPRKRRGVRHQVASVLAIATAAVLAGSCSVLAIGEWAAEAPQELLAALGARRSRLTGRYIAPHVATFRRLLRITDADAVDTAIGLFLAERAGLGGLAGNTTDDSKAGNGCGVHATGGPHQPRQPARQEEERGPRAGEAEAAGALAVDGKTVRGARQADGRAVHLLSAMVHGAGAMAAQRDVAHKTNEITQVKPLLDPLDLRGWAVTLDALHCQKEPPVTWWKTKAPPTCSLRARTISPACSPS